MKQYTLCLISFFTLLGLCTLPARAQNRVKALETVVKSSVSKAPSVPAAAAASRLSSSAATRMAASGLAGAGRVSAGSSVNPSATVAAPSIPPSELANLLRLQKENERLRALTDHLEKELSAHALPSDAYIFQARETGDAPTNIFSGTIFTVPYKGKNETYGVIATHSISSEVTEKMALHRKFTAIIYKNGLQHPIEVEIVAASPKSMLDIALVKFPADKEALLKPYSLGEISSDISLHSKGFAGLQASSIAERKVVSCTPNSIRTTIPVARADRPGLCGSAVLNGRNELVGIHTGSIANTKEELDVAYATPAHYLNNLIEAYHNGGKAKVPFTLGGRKIADLNMDEYITYTALTDADQKIIWQLQVNAKFSYSKLQEALEQHPQAKFLQLTTRRAAWTEDGYAFVENRGKTDRGPKTTYLYDLQEQKLIRTAQSVYNPQTRKRQNLVIEHNNL